MISNKNSDQGGDEIKVICPQKEDFSRWYNDVIAAADMAEHGPVHGTMIIKPYAYAIWEIIQSVLDSMIKKLGVQNAYFPLFIPEEFLTREAKHVEGFSPEMAVVTQAGGKKLESPVVVRPTSETIIYDAFSRWIQSYRDLPMTINQWANVVRWELRPRLFLRTTEFLWQEGHTAHATAQESEAYAIMILHQVYERFARDYLAMPVLTGVKSESEKFAGAYRTYCIEALMQDLKSLQAGTSHDLADNFAKAFNINFLNDKGERTFVHQTSWGVSTRLLGALIMTHSDDKGLVLPPQVAPIQVVITPIMKSQDDEVVSKSQELQKKLKAFRTHLDARDLRPGQKFYEWEKKGVPVRLELGPKDLAKDSCVLVLRDSGEKITCPLADVAKNLQQLLADIQDSLYQKALTRRDQSDQQVEDWSGLVKAIDKGGYVYAFWCENPECEAKIKEKLKATTRCQRFDQPEEKGEHHCVVCGKKSPGKRWVIAKAY